MPRLVLDEPVISKPRLVLDEPEQPKPRLVPDEPTGAFGGLAKEESRPSYQRTPAGTEIIEDTAFPAIQPDILKAAKGVMAGTTQLPPEPVQTVKLGTPKPKPSPFVAAGMGGYSPAITRQTIPESTFAKQTGKAWQRGGQAVNIDFLYSKVAKGEIDESVAQAAEKQFEELNKKDPIKARNFAEKLWLETVQMARPMASGTLRGAKYGTAAATVAALAGQAGPQVFIPEEVATVPSAYAIGSTVGSLGYWAEQGQGVIYREARKQGLDAKAARYASAAGGPLYAFIEYSQVDKIIPGFGKIKGRLLQKALQIGKNAAHEIAEEGAQQVVTDGSVAIGQLVEGKISTADVPSKVKEIARNSWEQMKASAGPLAVLQGPSAAMAVVETVTEKKPTVQAETPISAEKPPQVEPIAPAIAPEVVPAILPKPAVPAETPAQPVEKPPSVPAAGQTGKTGAVEPTAQARPGAEGKTETQEPLPEMSPEAKEWQDYLAAKREERKPKPVEIGDIKEGKAVEWDEKVPDDVLSGFDRAFYHLTGTELPEDFYHGYKGITLNQLISGFGKLGLDDEIVQQASGYLYTIGYTRIGNVGLTENGPVPIKGMEPGEFIPNKPEQRTALPPAAVRAEEAQLAPQGAERQAWETAKTEEEYNQRRIEALGYNLDVSKKDTIKAGSVNIKTKTIWLQPNASPVIASHEIIHAISQEAQKTWNELRNYDMTFEEAQRAEKLLGINRQLGYAGLEFRREFKDEVAVRIAHGDTQLAKEFPKLAQIINKYPERLRPEIPIEPLAQEALAKGEGEKAEGATPSKLIEESPEIKQWRKYKEKYPDTIMLFKMGDFYEMFGEDAEKASKVLGLTKTKTRREGMALAGVPYHAVDQYLKKLLQAGHRVAVVEQVQAGKKEETKRDVVRIVTPGPAIIEQEPKAEAPGAEIPPRPLVNPKASAMKRDKQLQRQQAWDRKYAKAPAPEAEKKGEAKGTSAIGTISAAGMKVEMEPKGKVQTAGEIIGYIGRAFNIPLRGKATFHKAALGWFDPKAVGIRMKDVRQLTTAMHEIGHHIDWTLNKRLSLNPPNAEMEKELLAMGKALYGSRKPSGGYKSEGWAEFMREYLTGDEAQAKAPAVYKWFTEEYLPTHPEINQKLDKTRRMVTTWRMQGAEARVESQISMAPIKGSLIERFKRGSLWFETQLRDELAALRRSMLRAGIKEQELRPDENPYQIAVARADKAGAIAERFVLEYTTDLAGNRTGKGLREILAPVAKDIKTFTKWIVSARARLLHERGINPGISKADADYVYAKYDSPQWRETLEEITAWNHRLLDYLAEAGGLEKEAKDAILAANPIYVPFMRAFQEGELNVGEGAGKGVAGTQKAIKSIKGSGREVIDPIESMIKQAAKIIGVAHKTQVAVALAKIAEKHGTASMIWKVPAPKEATRFEAEQLKRQIAEIAYKRMGLDPKEISASMLDKWDEILTVYSNSSHYYGKDNIISFVIDGKRQFYEVEPSLYRAIQGLDQYTLPWVLDFIFGKPARAVRLGATGLNASFGLIRNFLRDAMTFTVLSKHAKAGPVSAIGGIVADIAKTPGAEKFKSLGGKMASQILADRRALQHVKKRVMVSSVGGKTVYTVWHPIDALRELFGVTEAGTRIGEFSAALNFAEKKWGKGSMAAAIYALNAGQDVTTNFSRHGKIAKILNQIIPFFNAAIQGPDKIIRTISERPAETLLKALAALTIPALWLWWRNKDEEWYKNLPIYERVNYLHFEIPGTDKIIRIPVPFELGHIFQSVPVAALDAQYRKDPKLLTEAFGESLKQANPFDWPAVVGPVVDILANKDFAGRPIVPKTVEYKMPEDQYARHTSELMKRIGGTIGFSPAKLEHLVNSYSGGLFARVSRTAQLMKKEDVTASDIPVLGTLFTREPYVPKAQLDKFFDRRDELNRKSASKKITPQENLLRTRYNHNADTILDEMKKAGDAKTEKERIDSYMKIRQQLGRMGDLPEPKTEELPPSTQKMMTDFGIETKMPSGTLTEGGKQIKLTDAQYEFYVNEITKNLRELIGKSPPKTKVQFEAKMAIVRAKARASLRRQINEGKLK